MKIKKKMGRPKGGNSVVGVTLEDLNRVLREEATVMVSRKYAEQLNLTGIDIASENNGLHIKKYVAQSKENVKKAMEKAEKKMKEEEENKIEFTIS